MQRMDIGAEKAAKNAICRKFCEWCFSILVFLLQIAGDWNCLNVLVFRRYSSGNADTVYLRQRSIGCILLHQYPEFLLLLSDTFRCTLRLSKIPRWLLRTWSSVCFHQNDDKLPIQVLYRF